MIAIPGPPGAPVQWMVSPRAIYGVPRGLEYLSQVDQLLVHQQKELLESEYAVHQLICIFCLGCILVAREWTCWNNLS